MFLKPTYSCISATKTAMMQPSLVTKKQFQTIFNALLFKYLSMKNRLIICSSDELEIYHPSSDLQGVAGVEVCNRSEGIA